MAYRVCLGAFYYLNIVGGCDAVIYHHRLMRHSKVSILRWPCVKRGHDTLLYNKKKERTRPNVKTIRNSYGAKIYMCVCVGGGGGGVVEDTEGKGTKLEPMPPSILCCPKHIF